MASRGKAASTSKRILGKSELKNGKLDSPGPLAQPPKCPECASQKVWKDGLRRTRNGDVQRFICRSCWYRFCEPKVEVNIFRKSGETSHPRSKMFKANIHDRDFSGDKLLNEPPLMLCKDVRSHGVTTVGKSINSLGRYNSYRRVCASEGGVKNLVEVESRTEKRAAGATKPTPKEVKGKLVEHAFWMKKEGYADATIIRRTRLLTTLVKRGAHLLDPESVKATIARQQSWSPKTKKLAVDAYACFLKMVGGTWEPPNYKPVRKLPFIPTEQEIDQLISGCNRKTTIFLQLLKETGMRSGEAWMIRWIDFNSENKSVRVTPEKGGEPRILRVSNKLVAMLNTLPKSQPMVFKGSLRHFARSYRRQRKRIAHKLKNERTNEITFHTFRHWKATMEYAKTKDILHIMRMLGHRSIQNTLLYTQLVNFENDEFHSSTAKSVEEAQKLVEAGFEYVCDFSGIKLFRKRK